MSMKIRSLVSASLVLASLALAGSAFAGGAHGHGGGARALPSLTQEQKAKLDAAAEAEHKARTDLKVALAAQVEKGAIDRSAVAPQVAAEKLAEANARKVTEDTLTAAQKAELAKLHEAKRAAHEAKKHAKGDGEAKDGGHHGRGHDHLGKSLNLTPEQKKQIHERMKAEPQGDRGAERIVDRLDATVPVLTAAQRAELAANLRK
jgi:Spy/CpxP family protein refolding chaperone